MEEGRIKDIILQRAGRLAMEQFALEGKMDLTKAIENSCLETKRIVEDYRKLMTSIHVSTPVKLIVRSGGAFISLVY